MLVSSKKIVQRWKIPDFLNGIRADHYLVHHVGRISRNKAQKIIASGDFRLKDQILKASKRLHGGDPVELWRLPPDTPQFDSVEIQVLYEDPDLLILNKPGNLAVHPSARYLYQTVTHWLKINYPGQPIHPCHRLDRETSGILICAKNKATESQLKQAFMAGRIQKNYWAIVEGHVSKPFSSSKPLALQGSRGLVSIKMIEDAFLGKPAQTEFRPLFYHPVLNWSLVECQPKTGRQHQIRAHLALEGHPVVADKLYSMGEDFFDAYTKEEANLKLLPFKRQALHAQKVQFELNNHHYSFECSDPLLEDFIRACEQNL